MLPLSIADLERTREPLERATALPGAAFTNPAVFAWELDHVFLGGWLCVGHVDRLRERGDFVMAEIGRESVFVVADDDGEQHAFLNTCRHRGARIVENAEGRMARIQCPYHAWSYGFDGSLRSAPPLLKGSCSSTSAAPRRRRRSRSATSRCASRPTASATCAAPGGSSTTSRRTGRPSPRTTASACTARACTRSSTGSATTGRARPSSAPARGAAAR